MSVDTTWIDVIDQDISFASIYLGDIIIAPQCWLSTTSHCLLVVCVWWLLAYFSNKL